MIAGGGRPKQKGFDMRDKATRERDAAAKRAAEEETKRMAVKVPGCPQRVVIAMACDGL